MFKMPYSRKDHRHPVKITEIDGFLVPDRTAGLDHGPYSRFKGDRHGVGERKKRI
jgi:hypothetical protein